MLQNIRDNTQGVPAKIFVGLVVAVFSVWGIEYLIGSIINSTASVTVNGVEISEYEIEVASQRRAQELLNSLGPDADPSIFSESLIRETAINELVQQQLLYQAALNSGMAISVGSIDRQIAQIPDFQIDGVFNNERAQAVLLSGGYTPSTFRQALEKEALMGQLLLAYSESGFATASEVEQLAELTAQTRDFRFLLINLQSQASSIEVADSEIEAYYETNQDEFIRNEEVAIEYIILDKNDILSEISISEEQIEEQYQLELTAYQSEIERRASHILLQASSPEEREAALSLAAELKTRIDSGDSFEELALEYSDDTGSAETGGDVGYTTGDSFVETFESALQALEVDEVSEPVATEFGVHLIKLTEMSSTEFDTLEQARDRIIRDLQAREAEQIYQQRAEELSNLSFESLDLNDPSEILGLELQRTDLFDNNGGAGITSEPAIIDAAFSLEVLEDRLNSDLIRLNASRSAVIRVIEHNPPAVRDVSEVRGEIDIILRDQRVAEMARTTGETIVRNLENRQNIDALLESQDINWMQVYELSRDNSEGLNPEILDSLFSMEKPDSAEAPTITGFQLSTGEYVVIELQNVTPGSLEDLEPNEQNSLSGFITQQSGNSAFSSFLSSLRASAEIEQ